MRVTFFGNAPGYSSRFLEALVTRAVDPADHVDLVGVVSPQRFDSRRQALAFAGRRSAERALDTGRRRLGDRRRARGPGARAGPGRRLHHLALRAGAPILWPRTCSSRDVGDFVAGSRCDAVLVAGLDRILPAALIQRLPPIYNIHPSALPDHRGGLPEFWQLAAGERRGGVTLHRIDAGIDTGPVVYQHELAIEPWFDADALVEASIGPGIELMHRFLDTFPAVPEQPAAPGAGSYFPLPGPADLAVPFDAAAATVLDRARAAGWTRPLHLTVSRADWQAGQVSRAVSRGGADSLTLDVTLPSLLPVTRDEPPGTVWPAGRGLAVACNPGCVLFHHWEVAADG